MNIYTLHMGITRCYVIQDKGTIMVDGGSPGKLNTFINKIRKASIEPKQIKLIVQTHGHLDHIGSTKAIKEVTGAQVAMHEPDKEWLEHSTPPLPPGVTPWGHILIRIMSWFTRPNHTLATNVDIPLSDEDFSLIPFGIPGKIISTPGHTKGSISVLLDTGDAFIGDLAMNGFPFRLQPGLPVFAEDIKRVKESCRLLLDKGAKTFYPGHGKPFSADVMLRILS